jgi:hypothetical protein
MEPFLLQAGTPVDPAILILAVLACVALMAYAAYDADGPWGPLMWLGDLVEEGLGCGVLFLVLLVIFLLMRGCLSGGGY